MFLVTMTTVETYLLLSYEIYYHLGLEPEFQSYLSSIIYLEYFRQNKNKNHCFFF